MQESVLGFFGLMRRAGALAVGAEDAYDLAREGKARLLLLTEDAAKNTADGIRNAQGEHDIPLLRLNCTKAALGKALGVRECAAAAVLDTGFALALCKKLALPELLPALEARLAREKKRKQKKLSQKSPSAAPVALKRKLPAAGKPAAAESPSNRPARKKGAANQSRRSSGKLQARAAKRGN